MDENAVLDVFPPSFIWNLVSCSGSGGRFRKLGVSTSGMRVCTVCQKKSDLVRSGCSSGVGGAYNPGAGASDRADVRIGGRGINICRVWTNGTLMYARACTHTQTLNLVFLSRPRASTGDDVIGSLADVINQIAKEINTEGQGSREGAAITAEHMQGVSLRV